MQTENYVPCSIKILPREQWIPAAETAVKINPNNAPALQQFMMAVPDAVIEPEHLALLTTKYWGSAGVHLTVGFLDNPPADLRSRVLSHMNAWAATANVQFSEVSQNAQVRIARTPGDGYWSYLGTDILHIGSNQATLNLDSFTMNTPDSEFFRVVRHETGHTLGFPHEHLRTEIVNMIDREKAIAYFMQTQHWSREQVIAQVLTPIDRSALIATQNADPTSIMCYGLPGFIMKSGAPIPGGTNINPTDAQFASTVYPRIRQSSQSSASLENFNNRLYVAFVANNNTNNILVCSSANGLFWSDNIRINQTAKSGTAPSLAVFNHRLYISFIANNGSNDVLVCSSADGVTWTNNTRINQSAKAFSSPSLAVFNNRLHVCFMANNNSNDLLVCSSADGNSWTPNTRINQSARDGSSPALAILNNRLFVAFIANNASNDVLVSSSTDGTSWTGNTRINQSAKGGSSPDLAAFNNQLRIAFVANNNTNNVLVCSSADGLHWTNNTPIHQTAKDGTSPSLALYDGKIFISFIANNNSNNVLICSSVDAVNWTNNVPV